MRCRHHARCGREPVLAPCHQLNWPAGRRAAGDIAGEEGAVRRRAGPAMMPFIVTAQRVPVAEPLKLDELGNRSLPPLMDVGESRERRRAGER